MKGAPQHKSKDGWKRLRTWIVAAVISSGGALKGSESRGAEQSKDDLEAAIVLSLPNYIDWPKNSAVTPTSGSVVCVLGDAGPPFPPKKGNVTITRVRASQELAPCNVLFIPDAEKGRMLQFLTVLRSQPVITVSDAKGFAELGGIVEIYEEGSKFRLAVNLDSASSAGFRLTRLAAAAHRALKNGEWVSLR